MPRHLHERCARQHAGRIDRDVAEQLDPDFVTEARTDRTTQPARNQRLGNLSCTLGLRAVRLAEAQAIAFDVLDDAGLNDLSRKVRDRSHDAVRLDGSGDRTARIDSPEPEAFKRTAQFLE